MKRWHLTQSAQIHRMRTPRPPITSTDGPMRIIYLDAPVNVNGHRVYSPFRWSVLYRMHNGRANV